MSDHVIIGAGVVGGAVGGAMLGMWREQPALKLSAMTALNTGAVTVMFVGFRAALRGMRNGEQRPEDSVLAGSLTGYIATGIHSTR